MRTERHAPRRPSLAHALWLSLCLLLAQHAGLTHRVLHGGLQNQPLLAAAEATPAAAGLLSDPLADPLADGTLDEGPRDPLALRGGGHSCVLFDAAALADTHCSLALPGVLAHGHPHAPASAEAARPDLAPLTAFHPRAPPAALALA